MCTCISALLNMCLLKSNIFLKKMLIVLLVEGLLDSADVEHWDNDPSVLVNNGSGWLHYCFDLYSYTQKFPIYIDKFGYVDHNHQKRPNPTIFARSISNYFMTEFLALYTYLSGPLNWLFAFSFVIFRWSLLCIIVAKAAIFKFKTSLKTEWRCISFLPAH